MARSASKATKSPSQGSQTKVVKSKAADVKSSAEEGETPATAGSKGRGRPKGKGKNGAGRQSGSKSIAKLLEKQGIPNFSVYIHRVLKEVCPKCRISKTSMSIMNSFIYDMFGRITKEAAFCVGRNDKKTLDARALQSAVRLILPGELSKHAVSEGTKAVTKYTSYMDM